MESGFLMRHSDSDGCPMALGHPMTIGLLDADFMLPPSPADEHARSAVLLRFPCEQYH